MFVNECLICTPFITLQSLHMTSSLRKCLTLVITTLCLFTTAFSQTVLINPAGDGGFETGADFAANGWTLVNGTKANNWYVGTIPSGFTNRSAYISNNASGGIWEYTIAGDTSAVHFYRDITFPGGETDITLTFDWAAMGELVASGPWDVLMVSIAPTSFTPAHSVYLGAAGLPAPATTLVQLGNIATPQVAAIKIPASLAGNCTSASTMRLIFSWKNDDNTGTQPPAGIDNISLVSQTSTSRITAAGGTFTIDQTLPNAGNNFSSFTEAINNLNSGGCGPYNNPVIFNVAANQGFVEIVPAITASGTATAPITFRKNGTGSNPVVTRSDPGTLVTSTFGGNGDAVIVLEGADYVTFDAIDVSASDEGIEYGFLIRKPSATDGSKNVIIKNGVVTMMKGSNTYVSGIYSSNLLASSPVNSATGVTVTAASGTNDNISVSGMTINGAYHGIVFRGFSAPSPYTFYDQNNSVGVDSGNVINDFGGGTLAAQGIYGIYQNGFSIANNLVTSATGSTGIVYGIFNTTATNARADIFSNTVTVHGGADTEAAYGIYNGAGSTGTNNRIRIFNNTVTNSTYPTATSGSLYGIYQLGSADTVHIFGNTVSNNTLTNTTTGVFYGIYQAGSVVREGKIYNNTVTGNTRTSGTTGAFYCMYNTSSSTAITEIFGNTISNNSATGTTGTMYGINQTTGGVNNIYKNMVEGLTFNSTTGPVYGISITGGTTNNVYNNFISNLNVPTASATADGVRGINVNYTTANTSINLSYNTIYLNANSSGTNFSTSGIYHTTSATATSATLTLRNNNIVNLSTPNGTGKTTAYRRSSTTLTNYSTASNNNNFYAGDPVANPNNLLFYDGTNMVATLSELKTRLSPRESSSISEMPPFVNVATPPYDLHITPGVATQLESGGQPVPGILDDFDGNPRNTTSPDIGADEFVGIPADFSAPLIAYTPLGKESICVEAKTITATITDASGVDVAPGRKPRLWFKKATEQDALPATNNSAGNGWKYVEATNNASPFVFNFDFSLLTSPLMSGDSISYFIAAQDSASTPNVGASIVNFSSPPSSVALSASSFPTTGDVYGFTILTLPAITIKSNTGSLCVSGTVKLDVNDTNVAGGEFQWESSPSGTNNWSAIPGGTTVPFTTPVFNDTTDFRLVVKCGGVAVPASPSNVITVNVNNPQLASTTGASRCGTGTVNLSATAPGYSVHWFLSPTDDVSVFTGNTFTTPTIHSTDTFYAAASSDGGVTSIGMPAPINATSGSGTTNFGLVFDAISNFVIQSVTIYPIHATAGTPGTVVIDVIDGTGTVIQTATANVTGSPASSPVPHVVPVNFNIPVGTNYKMRPRTISGVTGLLFQPSLGSANWGYPFELPGIVRINTSTLGAAPANAPRPDLYYYFYDWQVETECIGTRVPVIATITPPPALTTSGSKTICNNIIDSIVVTDGTSSFDSFVWTPANGLYTDAAATVAYTGGSATKVHIRSSVAGTTGYTITATNNTTTCANAVTDSITVLPIATLSASKSEVCRSGQVEISLSPDSGYGNAVIVWQSGTDGINYNVIAGANRPEYTVVLTDTTYFRAIVSDTAGRVCMQPTTSVIVNNPQITVTDGMNCGPGQVQLSASGQGEIKWYTAASGGTPVGTGQVFTTPSLTTTTTYYASTTIGGGGTASAGLQNAISTSGYTLEAGLFFDALSDFTLEAVHVYPIGTGSGIVTIALENSAGTAVYTTDVTLTGTAAPYVKTLVTLNYFVPAGTGYRLVMLTRTGGVASLIRESGASWGSYPLTVPGILSITNGKCCPDATSTSYYYFYDWVVSSGCEGERVPVVATIDNSPGCTVPVTLMNFTGEKAGVANRLNWSTATETNNKGFELQRSADGSNFSMLSFVASKAEGGNSVNALSYQYIDEKPLKATNYYRLKQVDKDGRSAYSNIVALKGTDISSFTVTNVYPNPARNILNTVISAPTAGKVTIAITDLSGKFISMQTVEVVRGDNQVRTPVAELASGTYMLKVMCNNGCENAAHKFVKQ